MKKVMILFLAIIFGFSILIGCNKAVRINWVIPHDGWVYYTNLDEDALYKIKPDMTEKTKMTKGLGGYREIVGDYIYFLENDAYISKIKTDGTEYQRLSDLNQENIFGFTVSQDYVYYAVKSGSLYKVKIDGTENTKIVDIDSFTGEMTVADGWIYYKAQESLYKMTTAGAQITKLIDNVSLHKVKDGWLYYGEKAEKDGFKSLYRMKSDGTQQTKLADGAFAAIDGDWLYYTKGDGLYRANLDGTDITKMNDVKMWGFYAVSGDYVYYGEYSGAAYRINLDGSNKVLIK